jgi:hypothetical protein
MSKKLVIVLRKPLLIKNRVLLKKMKNQTMKERQEIKAMITEIIQIQQQNSR